MSKLFRLQMIAALAALFLFTTATDARQRGPVAPVAKRVDTAKAAAAVAAAPAEKPTEVRVLYFSGDVSVVDTAAPVQLAFGMLVDSLHTVIIGRDASMQFAVDGRIVTIERAGRLRRNEIIRRASGEKNEELMAALRSIASQGDFVTSSSKSPARVHAALAAAISPGARAASPSATSMLVPLEPRTTAVTRGPVRFRWLRSADAASYRVIVRDRYDNEILRAETSDTTVVWESAVLLVGSEYTWSLARVDDSLNAITSTFHRLDDLQGMRLEGGESRIRLALGSENPALPIALGAHFALNGCYADAARQFTTAALKYPEHFDRFLRLAREQYATNMKLSASELEYVQTLGAVTMNE